MKIFISVLLLLGAVLAFGSESISLQWDTPTQRQDGTPLDVSEIQGYRLYYVKDGVEQAVNVSAGTTSYVLNDVTPGTYEFRIATIAESEGPTSPVETVTILANVQAPAITRVIVERCTPAGVCTQEVIK